MDKPFSPACERNRDAILDVLRVQFADRSNVLEIGSGTGQHAVHMAAALPHLTWQTSDVAANLPGIRMWLADAGLHNTPAPLTFDVNGALPAGRYDTIFSANTLHILGWAEVEQLFARLSQVMAEHARLTVYGPFNNSGVFTSPGNAAFDTALRQDDPKRGIRDFEAVDAVAKAAGLQLREDRPMPANNRCITWQRH